MPRRRRRRSSASASTTATTRRSPSSPSPSLPVVFSKWPSSLIGTGQSIVLPPEEKRPDYEAELGIVFSETFTRATLENARSKVGGYCAFHDVSGRQYQLETPLRQFVLGKSFDTFGPMGPLVNADGVDLNALDVRGTVSGERHAELEHAELHLQHRAADRLRLDGDDHRGRRRAHHGHARAASATARTRSATSCPVTSSRSRCRARPSCAIRWWRDDARACP